MKKLILLLVISTLFSTYANAQRVRVNVHIYDGHRIYFQHPHSWYIRHGYYYHPRGYYAHPRQRRVHPMRREAFHARGHRYGHHKHHGRPHQRRGHGRR